MASLVSTQRGTGMATVSHYNVAPVVDIYGSVSGRDLGGVSRDINQIIDGMRLAAYRVVLKLLSVGRCRRCDPPTSDC